MTSNPRSGQPDVQLARQDPIVAYPPDGRQARGGFTVADSAEPIRVPLRGGGFYVDLKRLTDGRVLCQLCFGYFAVEDLHQIEPGVVEDACEPCWQHDVQAHGPVAHWLRSDYEREAPA